MLFKMRLFARAPPANNQRKIFLYHLFPVGFGNPIECHISNPLTYNHTYIIPSIPTPYQTYTIRTQNNPYLTLYLTYSKVHICQGALVSVIPPELKKKHRERSFFLAKECKSRVKFISVVDEKCAGK